MEIPGCIHRLETDPVIARKVIHLWTLPSRSGGGPDAGGEHAMDAGRARAAAPGAGRGPQPAPNGARAGDQPQHGEALPGVAETGPA